MTPWLERRLRIAASAAATVPGADDARLAGALAEVPRAVLLRMLAIADMGEEEGVAELMADPALLAEIEELMSA